MTMTTTALGTPKMRNQNERYMNFGMVMTGSLFYKKGHPIYCTYGTWHTNMTF